jgi:hypothetical protein
VTQTLEGGTIIGRILRLKIEGLTLIRIGSAANARIVWLGLCLMLACLGGLQSGAEEIIAGPSTLEKVKTIEFFPVGPSETIAATYGSHNQKTVATRYGIFFTYVDQVQSGRSRWRLMRTTDEGANFAEVWRGSSIGGAPVLETDGKPVSRGTVGNLPRRHVHALQRRWAAAFGNDHD